MTEHTPLNTAENTSIPAFPPSCRLGTTADLRRIVQIHLEAFAIDLARNGGQVAVRLAAQHWRSIQHEHRTLMVIEDIDKDVNDDKGEKCVVGFAVWEFPKGSKLIGKLQPSNDEQLDLPVVLTQVRASYGAEGVSQKLMDDILKKPADEQLAPWLKLDRVAILPGYQRQGHGSSLVRWGINVAEQEGVRLVTFALQAGYKLYENLGFLHGRQDAFLEAKADMEYVPLSLRKHDVRFATREGGT